MEAVQVDVHVHDLKIQLDTREASLHWHCCVWNLNLSRYTHSGWRTHIESCHCQCLSAYSSATGSLSGWPAYHASGHH